MPATPLLDVADAFLGRCRYLPRILISNKGGALFLNLGFDRSTHASVGDARSNILRGGIETVRHRLRMARSQRRGVRARGIALFVKCQPHARKVGCRRRRLLIGTELAVDLFPLLQRAAKLPNALANARAELASASACACALLGELLSNLPFLPGGAAAGCSRRCSVFFNYSTRTCRSKFPSSIGFPASYHSLRLFWRTKKNVALLGK